LFHKVENFIILIIPRIEIEICKPRTEEK